MNFDVGKISKVWAESENLNCTYFDSTSSTNLEAKNKIQETLPPFLTIASTQTAGRGRGENSWTSPPENGGFLSTWTYKLEGPPQPISTPLFGWALYKAFKEEFDLPFSIKAPNDLFINDLKVGGLLLEAITKADEHFLLVGLGVNIFSKPDLKSSTFLKEHLSNALEENQWNRVLSNINSLFSQASIACQSEKMAEIYIQGLEEGLKDFPENTIVRVLPDGSIELSTGDRIDWSDL